MLNPVLGKRNSHTLVYSTSPFFRVVFFAAAVIVALAVLSASSGPLLMRFNLLSTIIILVCLASGLYVERWVFDTGANRFERHLGVLFLYARKRVELDSLRTIVLYEYRPPDREHLRTLGARRRPFAELSVVDAASREYRLDTIRGPAALALRHTAERLSDFTGIPMEYRQPIPPSL